jgi:glycosyltransferase involved in cell wall biosynthesis
MKISVVTPCFNEEQNVTLVCDAVKKAVASLGPGYDYEHIFIDNASTDTTVAILKQIAAEDKRVKIIVNAKNFGVYRSPLHALFQASGDVIVPLCADLQDPPELIPEFVRRWEQGFKIVAAVKKGSREFFLMAWCRRLYYRILRSLSEIELINDFTGFGLYDKCVIDLIRSTGDHYPYVRGLVSEMGFPIARVEYIRPGRAHGLTKNRLSDLYAQAMNGIVNQSKVPLRLAAWTGLMVAMASLVAASVFFVYKLLHWQTFSVGIAPVALGLFFFSAVQLVFLGILGEYVGAIHGRLFQKWLVIEKERVNFD